MTKDKPRAASLLRSVKLCWYLAWITVFILLFTRWESALTFLSGVASGLVMMDLFLRYCMIRGEWPHDDREQ